MAEMAFKLSFRMHERTKDAPATFAATLSLLREKRRRKEGKR